MSEATASQDRTVAAPKARVGIWPAWFGASLLLLVNGMRENNSWEAALGGILAGAFLVLAIQSLRRAYN